MRVCLQRVSEAAVEVIEDDGSVRETGRIGTGALALAGFAPDDDEETLEWVARKVADLRIFEGPGGALDRSLRETGGFLLLVSQFTLYGDVGKGRRPDFHAAAPYAEAEATYERFRERCEVELPGRVETGEFGAKMVLRIVNDGPVTIWIER